MPVSPIPIARYRRLGTLLAGLLVSIALALSLAPTASAQPLPAAAPAVPKPTRAELVYAKVAQKVLDTRAGNKGKVLNYRKAKKAAGKRKTVAQDVALGMLFNKGKVTHRSKADNKALKARAKKLGLPALARKIKLSDAARMVPVDPCPGINKIELMWYGPRMKLDDCNVKKVLAGAETVAFTGGLLVTFFPADKRSKLIMGIALSIIAAGDFALRLCNRKERGVTIYNWSGLGLGIFGWCRSQ